MASALESYVNKTVSIVTADGRIIVGMLKGFDQTINLILDESHERVYSSTEGVEHVILGLYIVRGDNVKDDYVAFMYDNIVSPVMAMPMTQKGCDWRG